MALIWRCASCSGRIVPQIWWWIIIFPVSMAADIPRFQTYANGLVGFPKRWFLVCLEKLVLKVIFGCIFWCCYCMYVAWSSPEPRVVWRFGTGWWCWGHWNNQPAKFTHVHRGNLVWIILCNFFCSKCWYHLAKQRSSSTKIKQPKPQRPSSWRFFCSLNVRGCPTGTPTPFKVNSGSGRFCLVPRGLILHRPRKRSI